MRKAIRAELRKESQTFPGYFKYELDVQEEDGTIIKNVPAYGKDLQDALNRTVRKDKIEKVEKTFNNLPDWLILSIFMVYMSAIAYTSTKLGQSWPIVGGMIFIAMVILGIKWISIDKQIKD